MKFAVRKTSRSFFDETPPIDGLVHERFTRVDARTSPSPEAFDENIARRFGNRPWLSEGVNHRVLEGGRGIARDFPDGTSGWFCEIETLDELIAFADEHGDIIIGRSSSNPDVREIEIYDSWRE